MLGGLDDSSARIESAPVPQSPTEEELTVAKTWQARHRRARLGLPALVTDAECEVAEEAAADDY